MSEGEQGEHEGEATALWSILLGALHNDRRKRQPEMLVPPTENMAAAEAIKANETVETEARKGAWRGCSGCLALRSCRRGPVWGEGTCRCLELALSHAHGGQMVLPPRSGGHRPRSQ